jgi:hypothetical protein
VELLVPESMTFGWVVRDVMALAAALLDDQALLYKQLSQLRVVTICLLYTKNITVPRYIASAVAGAIRANRQGSDCVRSYSNRFRTRKSNATVPRRRGWIKVACISCFVNQSVSLDLCTDDLTSDHARVARVIRYHACLGMGAP